MKDETIELILRYRCPNCKNIESHHKRDKKRMCKKCGEILDVITEKEYQHYKYKLKKYYEEDHKEVSTKSKDKNIEKKKKKSDNMKGEALNEEPKPKIKMKKNSSTKNIADKNYIIKKIDNNKSEGKSNSLNKSNKEKSNKKEKKKKNRHNSIQKIGPIVSDIVSNLFNQKKLEKALNKLDELSFSDMSDFEGANIIVNHDANNNTSSVTVNNKEIYTEVFDPIFNSFGQIFGDDFVNNFLQNFSSTLGDNYFEDIQNIVNNNQQYATKNKTGPVKDDILNKLKKFKLTKKYCKKGKDGKIELPNCCICLSEIEKGKESMLLPCGHIFHYKCCLGWLKNNNTCPMCRFEIK